MAYRQPRNEALSTALKAALGEAKYDIKVRQGESKPEVIKGLTIPKTVVASKNEHINKLRIARYLSKAIDITDIRVMWYKEV